MSHDESSRPQRPTFSVATPADVLGDLLRQSAAPCVFFQLQPISTGGFGDALVLCCNPAFSAVTGLAEEDIASRRAVEVLAFVDTHILTELEIVALTGCCRKYEQFIEMAKGYYEMTLLDLGDLQVAAYLVDVTARREREESLTAALRKNSLLLRELHHRVKNNLQVILSLVELQKGSNRHERAREALAAVEGRLRAIAYANELLLSLPSNSIELSALLQGLAEELFAALDPDEARPKLRLQGPTLRVGADAAVPLALIANEVIGNALWHGRPGDGGLVITAEWRRDREGVAYLSLRDNGGGFPGEVLDGSRQASGLAIVRALAQQLRGEVGFSNVGDGASVELSMGRELASFAEAPQRRSGSRGGTAGGAEAADPEAGREASPPSQSGLTSRQLQIMQQVVRGATSKEIAFAMGISTSTVKNHLATMYRKFGVASRIELINRLKRLRLL